MTRNFIQNNYGDVLKYKRINVVGTSGSGKSTVSRLLSHILKIEYIEMDELFWGPNWSYMNDEDFFTKLENALDKEAWILDGNYTRTIPIKWKQVQLVIWLDYSFIRTMIHAIKRAITRSITQEELWEGTNNRESFKKSFFSKDSIILWTMNTHKKVRQKYDRFMNDINFSDISFMRFRNPKEIILFLSYLQQHA